MTLKELQEKDLNNELSVFMGDHDEAKYKAFTPILSNLYENKVIYYERFVCIAVLENVRITPEGFRAVVNPYLKIEKEIVVEYSPDRKWEMMGSWAGVRLQNNYLSAYSSWAIYPEPDLVRRVETLVKAGKHEEALNLTLHH